MNNIIKIDQQQLNGALVQTANGRELHTFLEVGKDFSTWIKARIEQYGFVEHHDFVTFDAAPQNGGAGNRGLRIEYALTLDMAKELSMVERNAKGKEARQYFLECERRSKEVFAIPQTLPDALRLAADLADKNKVLEQQLRIDAPKVEVHDRISEAVTTLCIRDAAKTLQIQPSKLTSWLVVNKWIYHRIGKSGYLAYQDRIQAGHLTHKSTPYRDSVTGDDKISEQVRITGDGLTTLARKLNDSDLLGSKQLSRKCPGGASEPPLKH